MRTVNLSPYVPWVYQHRSDVVIEEEHWGCPRTVSGRIAFIGEIVS